MCGGGETFPLPDLARSGQEPILSGQCASSAPAQREPAGRRVLVASVLAVMAVVVTTAGGSGMRSCARCLKRGLSCDRYDTGVRSEQKCRSCEEAGTPCERVMTGCAGTAQLDAPSACAPCQAWPSGRRPASTPTGCRGWQRGGTPGLPGSPSLAPQGRTGICGWLGTAAQQASPSSLRLKGG